MTAFENKVTRHRKVSEILAVMREQVSALTHEQGDLEADIISDLAEHPELFDVATQKNLSMGRVGNTLFTVAYGKRIERKNGKSTEDQEWLASLNASELSHVVNTKYSLNKELIRAEVKADLISTSLLKEWGIVFGATAKLNTKRIMSDAELNDLIEASKELAEEE